MGAIHDIDLHTRDGERVGFQCREDETVMDAAASSGITLPSMCRQGSCGVCRARCMDGAYRLGEHSPLALSDEAAAGGEVLLCRTYPRGPLSLAVDQDSDTLTAPPVPERQATIAALEAVGGGVMRLELTLEADSGGDASANFEPGQYMRLTPEAVKVTRAYSMANTPNWDGLLEFYIRLQPNGRFSEWLRRASPGDRLQVEGPDGSLRLDESRLDTRYFVAGGTGLAPMLSMLRWMAEMQAPQPARLYFGVDGEADLFAEAELRELEAALPGLTVEFCVWHPQGDWAGYAGTPVEALERDLALAGTEVGGCDIYVCGPLGLVEATEAIARSRGIATERMHGERFLPA